MPFVPDPVQPGDQQKAAAAAPSWYNRFVTRLAAGMGPESELATAQKYAPGTGSTADFYQQGDSARATADVARGTVEGAGTVLGALPGVVAGAPTGPVGAAAFGMGTGALGAMGAHEGVNAITRVLGGVDKQGGSARLWDDVMSGVQGAINTPISELTSAGMRGLGLLGMRFPLVGSDLQLRPGAKQIASAIAEPTEATPMGKPIGTNAIFQKVPTEGQVAAKGFTQDVQTAIEAHPGARRAAAIEKQAATPPTSQAPQVGPTYAFDPVRQRVLEETTSKGGKAAAYFQQQDSLYNSSMAPMLQQYGATKFAAPETVNVFAGPLKTWASNPEFGKELGITDTPGFLAIAKANGQFTLEQMLSAKQAIGTALRRDTLGLRGGLNARNQAEQLYGALSNDINTAAQGVGMKDQVDAANAIYTNSMKFAGMVHDFVNGSTAQKLLPDDVQVLKTVLSPATFDAWSYKALQQMGMKTADMKGHPPAFDLGTWLKSYNDMDPNTKDMMFKWANGAAQPGQPAANQARQVLDKIAQTAASSEMFGSNVPSNPPNVLVDAFRRMQGPAAKAILQMFMSVGPDMGTLTNPVLRSNQRAMEWIAKGFTLDPKDATGRLAWTIAAPMAEVKQALFNQWQQDKSTPPSHFQPDKP